MKTILKDSNKNDSIINKAMRYTIENGGKRLRPIVAIEFCKVCGGNPKSALPFACAVELIHSTSLIQDDLPMMDNAPTRRGKQACHIKFGEPIAILASDALSVLAFEVLISYSSVSKSLTLKAAQSLVEAVGANGLVEGQTLDILNENKDLTIEELEKIYLLKTETLFSAAAKLGCIAGKSSNDKLEAATIYAKNIGLAYQIIDDILDLTASEDVIGKKPFTDVHLNKTTYPKLIGIDKSRQLVTKLTREAIKSLDAFPKGRIQFLKEFALTLEKRQY